MINEKALEIASKKLRRLRLTTVTGDRESEAVTVKSCFKAGLGGIYEDNAITYALRFAIKYYLQEL